MDEMVRALFDEWRGRIDDIDGKLAHLLEERMMAVTRIAGLKARHGIAVLDPDRERIVLENIRESVRDAEFEPYLLRVFKEIMAASRAYQQDRIAAQPEGNRLFRVGLLGAKLGHSRSPEIHAIWFRLHGMSGSYDLLERSPEELEGLLPVLKAQGYRGINVTIPYKTPMMRHLDELSPEALRIGAVNTIVIGEKNMGHNTDYAGFGHLVESVLGRTGAPLEAAIAKAAVLGTGGSSRAVITWLEDHGAREITLVSRDPDEASMKWPGLRAIGYDAFQAAGCDLVVNTTPVGMFPHPDASPLEPECLRGAGCVIDLIYNPLETRLMKDAAKYGIPCANGLRMLVAQAVEAHSIWHGIPYDGKDADAILAAMTGEVAGA